MYNVCIIQCILIYVHTVDVSPHIYIYNTQLRPQIVDNQDNYVFNRGGSQLFFHISWILSTKNIF